MLLPKTARQSHFSLARLVLGLSVTLALLLAACGDAPSTVVPATTAAGSTAGAATTAAKNATPANFYVLNGASTANVPETLKASLAQYEAQFSGSKYQAYTINDQSDKVKTSLAEAFKKEGWQNLTPAIAGASGTFTLIFNKDNKGAAAIGFPGTMAGLGQNQLLYIVFLPQ